MDKTWEDIKRIQEDHTVWRYVREGGNALPGKLHQLADGRSTTFQGNGFSKQIFLEDDHQHGASQLFRSTVEKVSHSEAPVEPWDLEHLKKLRKFEIVR